MLSFLNSVFQRFHLTNGTTKRQTLRRFGLNSESLESRALLSAIIDHAPGAADVAEVTAVARKQSASYPNLNGTWNVVGTNGTVFAGTVTFQQTSFDSLTGTVQVSGSSASASLEAHRKGNKITLEVKPTGAEDTTAIGRFDASHTQLTFRSKADNPAGGKTRVTTVITLDSNTNPTHFTLTIYNKKTAVASVTATRVVEI